MTGDEGEKIKSEFIARSARGDRVMLETTWDDQKKCLALKIIELVQGDPYLASQPHKEKNYD